MAASANIAAFRMLLLDSGGEPSEPIPFDEKQTGWWNDGGSSSALSHVRQRF
jgi:hypothetical protein